MIDENERVFSGDVSLDVQVEGMTCASCVARIEKRLASLEGVSAVVNFATGRAHVTGPGATDSARVIQEIEKAGYSARLLSAEPQGDGLSASPGVSRTTRRSVWRVILSAAFTAPIVLFAMVPATRFPGWSVLSLLLATPVVFWAGLPFHRGAVRALRHGSATMDTLVSAGTLVAYIWSLFVLLAGGDEGYWEVSAVVTTVVLLGRYLEERARGRAGSVLAAMSAERTHSVTVRVGRDERAIAPDDVTVGDHVVVRPGERVPVDGLVISGNAALDASSLTGELTPVEVDSGDRVTAGSVALGGILIIEAQRVGADTRLAQIASSVETAQLAKTQAQRLADRVSGVFVPTVLVVAVITFVMWVVTTHDVAHAVTAAVAVLVVACPCALGLATPVALLVGTSSAAAQGIVVSGVSALEQAGRIDTVVFDKTGTLTSGQMRVTTTVAVENEDPQRVRELAAAAERGSEHPIGRALMRAVPHAPEATGFRSMTGWGIEARVGEHTVSVTRVWGDLPPALAAAARQIRLDGASAVLVSVDGDAHGIIGVGDPLRGETANALQRIRRQGARVIALSGDHPDTVRALTHDLGFADVRGGASPEEKAEFIRSLQTAGHRVAMVGDGVNDAAALAQADLGIACGTGTDLAIAAADVTLVRSDILLVPTVLALSTRMLATIRGNLVWAFAYNVLALPLAALGTLNPMWGGAAMAFSSVVVVLNSLRLRKI